MPSQYIPKPKTKTVQCRVCGESMEVGYKTRTPKRCVDCGIKEYVTAMNQISDHWGPHYEAWLNGMKRSISA